MPHYCQGVHFFLIVYELRRKTLESDAKNYSNKLCHPSHDDEQQQQAAALQLQQQQHSNTEQQQQKYLAGTYKYIPVRRTAAYSIIIICQVQARILL